MSLAGGGVKKSAAADRVVPSPGWRSFLSTTQKGTKKVTAVGTELPWLALRHSQDKLVRKRRTQTVSCSAPDAAPSSRSLSQGGI